MLDILIFRNYEKMLFRIGRWLGYIEWETPAWKLNAIIDFEAQ